MLDRVAPQIVRAKIHIPPPEGLTRDRLIAALSGLWSHRLGLVTAPAGSGKTTLLTHFASVAGAPVAWYRAERSDGEAAALLRHLAGAFSTALGAVPSGWNTLDDALIEIEALGAPRLLFVIDDLHSLEGTDAEALLERFIDLAPPGLSVLAATRRPPQFNLSRFRVSDAVLEIGPDDLRFRSWEVESLFRDVYGEPLAPQDLGVLARRTEGWAAGLQLFHLATRGKNSNERNRTLSTLQNPARLAQDYLAQNVLAGLPEDLRRFLIDSCVLGRLSGPLCDKLLGLENSHLALEELHRRQLFTFRLEGEDTYRYHEVFRSHLERMLVHEIGEEEARARYRCAGEILEESRATDEALHAYCRAEDWGAVARVLGRNGDHASAGSNGWIDSLPSSVLNHDPWVLLTTARYHRAAGSWDRAIDAYRRAEQMFVAGKPADVCRVERRALTVFLEPEPGPLDDWWGAVRAATVRDPNRARTRAAMLDGAPARLAEGLALLIAGRLAEARALLLATASHTDASPLLVTAAQLGAAVAATLSGDANGSVEAEAAAEEAERLRAPWLALMARAVRVPIAETDASVEAEQILIACAQKGDAWGSTLIGLLLGLAKLQAGLAPVETLEIAAHGLRELGADALAAWAEAGLALSLARTRDLNARKAALGAEAAAAAAGVRAPLALASLALAECNGGGGVHLKRAEDIAQECSLALPRTPSTEPLAEHEVRVRLFGNFEITIDGEPVDLGRLRPRARTLLRILALRHDCWVHREVLTEALWPDVDPQSAVRNLHVALSSLRKVLDPYLGAAFLVREGDAYRLTLPPGGSVDIADVDRSVKLVNRAVAAADADGALSAFNTITEISREGLLPEEGPADWLVSYRDRIRIDVVESARQTGLLVEPDDPVSTVRICREGLQFDPTSDALWRLVISSSERCGDAAAAAQARIDYGHVLASLGLADHKS